MNLAPPLLWLVLTGCLRGSYYPSHDGLQLGGDTGPIGTTAPAIPCSGPDQGTLADLTVQNPTPDRYQLSMMDDACLEVFVAWIEPNDAYNGDVGNHRIFVIRTESGAFVKFFGIPSGTQVSWTEDTL